MNDRNRRMWAQAHKEAAQAPINQQYASPEWSRRLLNYQAKLAHKAIGGSGRPVLYSAKTR